MKIFFYLCMVMLGISVSAQVSRVQSASGNTGANAAATISVTMSTAPVNGNTLIAIIATRGTTAGRVSGITQTGATWTKAVEGTNTNGSTTEIWYAPNVSNTGTTVTIAQASLLSAAVIAEYSGLLSVNPLDVTKSNFGNGNTISNGGSPTTSQANELLIAGVGITNSSFDITHTASFTGIASDASTNATATNNSKVYAYDRIVTATGVFGFGAGQPTSNSTNAPWTSALASFKIVTNTAGVASSTPTLCINTPLTTITHSTTLANGIVNDGVPGANGLPTGVSASWSNNTITISGTPTAAGTYNYNIQLSGGVGTINASGTITVHDANTVYLASAANTNNQTVCINTGIGTTQYQFNGLSAMTGVTVANLPTGVSHTYNNTNKVVNISGTPLQAGTFNYTVTATGGACDAITANGTITVTPNHIAAAGSSAPILYVNTTLTPITHTTSNANGINTGAITGLPSGTNASFASNTVTISGTPTATGTFAYNIPLTGSCGTGAATGTIKVCPALVGGTIAGSTTVCRTSNSTTLTLSGQTGTISRWESSLDNFATPGTAITNTTTSLTASSLTATTYYRAVITALSGACIEYSTTATITVSLISLGGTIDGSATVCSGTNSTTLTLSGHRGTITRWESSPVSNFGSGITTINNTTTTLTATNLTATTYYRAVITNSPCANAVTAVVATVSVSTAIPATPGAITGEALLCNNSTNKTYSIAAVTNATTYDWTVPTGWSITAGAGTRIITVTVGSADQNGNISVTAQNACGTSTARTLAVSVAAESVGGTITGSATVCTGTNSTTLTLSGHTGAITRWESSTSSTFASGVNSITNTAATLTALNLATTTYYRAVLTSGACASSNSASAALTVSLASVGGTIAGSATVLTGTNSTTLILSGYTGSITRWESSLDNFATAATSIATTTTTLTATNLTATTSYRAVITSGACGAANSAIATVMVAPAATAQTFCGNKTVSDLVAIGTNLKWYDVATNGTALTATTAITTGTYYVSQTVNGSESSRTSVAVTINNSVAGTISANQTIISGMQPADITLTNSSGDVQWQQSTNNINFTDIVGATGTALLGSTIGALTANKYFRAIINNNGCGNVTSAVHSVIIIFTTNIKPSQWGTTLNAINSQIVATIYPSAQMYRFEVSNAANVRTYDTTKYIFDLTKMAGSKYATTYSIKVAVKVNNTWGDYGAACNITTPTIYSANDVPASKLRASQCGSTLTAIGSPIHSELVYGAEAYRFQLTNGTTVTEVESPIYYFFLTNTNIGTYGTTFSIKTRAKIDGVWGNYGTACAISTPALSANTVPLTQVSPSFCNTTLAAVNTKIPAVLVYNAEGYRFEITNGTNVTVYDAALYNFKLSDAGIVATNGTTYAIRVAAKINGVYGNYGASCNVTMPGNASNSKAIIENTDFSLVAYPNPSNSDFKLQFNGANEEAVSILVFDMMGRQIENKEVNASDIENITIGQNYSAGIYNVIVSQGMNSKTVRLVKN